MKNIFLKKRNAKNIESKNIHIFLCWFKFTLFPFQTSWLTKYFHQQSSLASHEIFRPYWTVIFLSDHNVLNLVTVCSNYVHCSDFVSKLLNESICKAITQCPCNLQNISWAFCQLQFTFFLQNSSKCFRQCVKNAAYLSARLIYIHQKPNPDVLGYIHANF